MLNARISKLALAGALFAVILVAAQETRAGGFSIRIGGLGIGSRNTRCVERSYIYYSNFDDDWDEGYSRERSYRPVYRVQPYRGGRRHFRRMHHRRQPEPRRRGRRHGGRRR